MEPPRRPRTGLRLPDPMSVLRNLETKLADLVEGGFGRMFRSEVRPVELARRLAKEMDEHRTDSLAAHLRAQRVRRATCRQRDRERFDGSSARSATSCPPTCSSTRARERLALASRPVIELRTDERLGLGEFGIEARMVGARPAEPERRAGSERPTAARWSTPPPQRVQERARRRRAPAVRGRAILEAEGKRFVIAPTGALIGRSRECDIVLERLQRLAPPRARSPSPATGAGRSRTSARPTACASTAARSKGLQAIVLRRPRRARARSRAGSRSM